MITINIIEKTGETKYLLNANSVSLGRKYEHNAEYIKVNKPLAEANNICTMIVTANGKTIDHINVGEEEIPVTSNLSQYDTVKIGFSFSGSNNYIKNTEVKQFYFLSAQRPESFEPSIPFYSGNVDRLISLAFADVDWKEGSHNTLVFKDIDGKSLKEIDLHSFTQEQADLSEKDNSKASFVQGKKTSNLINDGDGSSPFATLKDIENIKPAEVDMTNYYNKEEVDKTIDNIGYNSRKVIILGGDGIIAEKAILKIKDYESFMPYLNNNTEFLISAIFAVTGDVDLTKELVIEFGDTTYYVTNAVDTSRKITLGDLDYSLKQSLVTGYNYLFKSIFFRNTDNVGFAVLPDKEDVLSLNSEQMDNYMAEGGLPQGQLAICNKVITNGYTEGAVYRFKITYPSTYEWEELVPSRLGDLTLNQTGSMLKSTQAFTGHIHTMVEFETDGMHYGADFVLHPFDSSICLVSFSFGTHTSTAYLDESGYINISIPSGLSVTNIKAHFIKLNN